MPLIDLPTDSPVNLREDPTLGSFDFSQEEDILQLSDRQLAAYDDLLEHAHRVNAWVEEKGIEHLMRERLSSATQSATQIAGRAILEVMTGERCADFDAFIRRQDPIILSNRLGGLFPAYGATLKHLDTAMSYGSGIIPEFADQIRHTANEVVKVSLLHTLSYIAMWHKMLDRIEHGVPAWDEENGCEKDLEPGIPTMSDFIASASATKVEERQADDQVAVRLLSGLLDEDQSWV